MTKKNRSKYIFLALRIGLVVAAIIYAVYWSCQEQRWKVFLQIDPWLFAIALLTFIGSQILIGIRWWLLLRTQSVYIDWRASVRLNLLGVFYSNIMPSSVGGDFLRAWYVTKHTERKFVAVLSVFADRIIGMASIAVMAIGSWMLFMRGRTFPLKFWNVAELMIKHKNVLGWLAFAILIISIAILASSKNRKSIRMICEKSKSHIRHAFKTAIDAFWMYCKSPLMILWTFLLTVFLQSVVVISMWLIAEKMGMKVSIKYFFVFFPVSWVLGAVPVTPGGAVLVEGTLVMLFTQFTEATIMQAFAISMCQRFIWLLSSIPGIMIHLSGTHLPKDITIDGVMEIN